MWLTQVSKDLLKHACQLKRSLSLNFIVLQCWSNLKWYVITIVKLTEAIILHFYCLDMGGCWSFNCHATQMPDSHRTDMMIMNTILSLYMVSKLLFGWMIMRWLTFLRELLIHCTVFYFLYACSEQWAYLATWYKVQPILDTPNRTLYTQYFHNLDLSPL